MTHHDPLQPWSRLTAAARNLPDERDPSAPYGFSTRVAALAFVRRNVAPLLERLALRAFGVSCLIAVLTLALNYRAITLPAPSPIAPAEIVDLLIIDPMEIILGAGE
jgi:hypothetical protein